MGSKTLSSLLCAYVEFVLFLYFSLRKIDYKLHEGMAVFFLFVLLIATCLY